MSKNSLDVAFSVTLIASLLLATPVYAQAPTSFNQEVAKPAPTEPNPVLRLEGTASYYSRTKCLGCRADRKTASGELLQDEALTMAVGTHLKHFIGSTAQITNLETGTSVAVKINDTGSFHQTRFGHRVADVTPATKKALGLTDDLAQVRVEILP